MDPGALALVGAGRAGTALAAALVARGWTVTAVASRSPRSARAAADRFGARVTTVEEAGRDATLVVLATPDGALGDVAARVAPSLGAGALVVHLSGASTLEVLDPIARTRPDVSVGSLHPLQTLPVGEHGAARLAGAWCAVEGPVVTIARSLGMHPIVVTPEHRSAYHAAATIASNHVVALLGQVARLADVVGVPFEAFLPLAQTALDNVSELGPRAALTGPVARGDLATVATHLDALPDAERPAYRAVATAALQLVGRDDHALRQLLEEWRDEVTATKVPR